MYFAVSGSGETAESTFLSALSPSAGMRDLRIWSAQTHTTAQKPHLYTPRHGPSADPEPSDPPGRQHR